MLQTRNDLRNIAIIAHVDHGKTTLVDGMLKQARVFRENQDVVERVLDSNDLERERGITILAKNTAISLLHPETGEPVKINIVDTPGHADFGGEVERVLNMVDGVLLLVDAAEGPMPQTRFVLRKALEMGHKAVVVINKVDRKGADPDEALNKTFDLFIELGATDEQADFAVVYANALLGHAGDTYEVGDDLEPLFRAILNELPAPVCDDEGPLQLLVTTLGYDEYRGVTAVGRVHRGHISVGDRVVRIKADGTVIPDTAQYLYVFDGLAPREITEARAGDIVMVAGLQDIGIGETLADPENPEALPTIHVEEPTVKMTFGVNTSPFAGREGRWGTSRHLRERLYRELRSNVALRVEDTESPDQFVVSGRGELHLAILIETMRREGYEFQVSRPEVLYHRDEDGNLLEPFEDLHVETTSETVGVVMEMLGTRRGKLQDMYETDRGATHLTYLVPTRGLLGFRYQFLTATRGMGTLQPIFHGYLPLAGDIPTRATGSLVSWEPGLASTFGLKNAEERGMLFYGAGVEVYEGMVIGERTRPGDLSINVCKKKHLTNMRSSTRDIEVRLKSPRSLSLDEAIEYLAADELLEVTPVVCRVRKKILDTRERGKDFKRGVKATEDE